jgi:hypothetical protein
MGRGGLFIAASCIFATLGSSFAENVPLLRAVAFALTGRDHAKVQSVDRAKCVFRLDHELFRLNNVEVDRLSIMDEHFLVTIKIRGGDPVYESDAPDMFAGLKGGPPGPVHVVEQEHTITFMTDEVERVSRAWRYIYSHGCVGQKSPF